MQSATRQAKEAINAVFILDNSLLVCLYYSIDFDQHVKRLL
jgi:hypothetical protein